MTTSPKTSESLPEVHQPGPHGPTPPSSGKPKRRGLIWVVFLLIVAGVAGYAVWQAGRPGNTRKGQGGGGGFGGGRGASLGPVPVVVTKVARSSIPVYLNGLGNVSPFYTVTVKSRVDGQLVKVDFNEGDLVKEGQVLIEIDPRPYQVQLDLAQATLAHDQALLANAKLDLDRYKQLVKTDAIPSQQLDTQVALVAQYEATIKQDQAAIDNAKLQLVYSKITAPITGVVGLRLVDPGNIVHAADTNGMITITQLQPIAVLFTIPEDSLPAVTKKLRAGAHLPADAYNRDNSQKLASGTLVTLDNQIDNTTGTSKLKAVFPNKDNALFPQQFVNIRLLVDTLGNQLVVPNVAVQNGQQGTFVYVVDDDSTVHLKPVHVGITTATDADILSGISDGDRVVVDGTDRLVEGAAVRVRKAGELDNPAGFDAGGGGGGGRRGRGGSKKGGNFKKGQSGGAGR
ncbi:MAG: MdtA/MuxA family multidrug efflux RND transporter periplasmic adaptor subunit [Bryobacteraceae bacterium]|jgi:multidrug efflux system membrane fusion protein